MTNLFIINTPFHLLTSFIIANSFNNNDTNLLLLINPHGYAKRNKSPILGHMIKTGFQQSFVFTNFLSNRHKKISFKKQIQNLKYALRDYNIDTIYLGSDIYPQNQIAVATLNHNSFIRYEDGLYSYYNDCRRRSKLDELYHKLKIKLTMKLSGVQSNLKINTSTASDSQAGIADFMYNPSLLKRFSPKTYEITTSKIKEALDKLKNSEFIKPSENINSILYLSQPLVEQKILNKEAEINLLQIMSNLYGKDMQILYKPHPNDNPEKAIFYKNNLPNLKIIEGIEPAELLYSREESIKAIVSYQSTALLYTNKFSNHFINSISLAKLASYPLHPMYEEIMKKSGVIFPESLQELQNIK